MQGRRSLGLPLETPLQESTTKRRTPSTPLLEEGALSDLFGSLSLDSDSTTESSSSNSISSSSSSEEEQVVGEEEPQNNPPMENYQHEQGGPQLIMRKLAKPVIPSSTSPIDLPEHVRNYELRGMYFNQLPNYHGLPNEDALTFMRTFYGTVENFLINQYFTYILLWFLVCLIDYFVWNCVFSLGF